MSEQEVRFALAHCVEPASLPPLSGREDLEEQWQKVLSGECGPTAAHKARTFDVEEARARTAKVQAEFLTPEDPRWPKSLGDLDAPIVPTGIAASPLGVWVRGDSTLLNARAVAIVGARAATAYGEQVAADFAAELAAEGIVITSGGAYGIDASAHRGALAVEGPTVMVSAAGVDLPYPKGLSSLWGQICHRGCVVSEYPPGTTPARHRFLARNRLIAALSTGTVLVEAAARSGAKNTVTWASRLSRIVMAVPGPVSSGMSTTPHALIRDQEATLVANAAEVSALIGPGVQIALLDARGEVRLGDGLSDLAMSVCEALPYGAPLDVGEVALAANCSVAVAWAALAELEAVNIVRRTAEGFQLDVRPDQRVERELPARLA